MLGCKVLPLLVGAVLFVGFAPFIGWSAAPPKKAFTRAHVPNQLIVKLKSSVAPKSALNFLGAFQVRVVRRLQVNGAYLVESASLSEHQQTQSQKIPNQRINSQTTPTFSATQLQGLALQMAANDEVEYVEPNWYVRASLRPNDPELDQQYAFRPTVGDDGRRSDIQVEAAWMHTTGSRQVLVAVVDSGVDYTHPDLADNIWHNPGENGLDGRGRSKATNGVDDDGNGFVDDHTGWDFADKDNTPMDANQHGTHCAGSIGAVSNNGIGITGLNWETSIVPIKFLNAEGVGTTADGADAINYATSLGVHVMNNSWGGDEYSETMAAAIRKANHARILFVVAAGNNGNDNDIGPDYPASYAFDNILSVAATDANNQLAGFSNYGLLSVHLAAPGVGILSTFPGGQYGVLDGTSMAAPYVSGAAALLKARYPQLGASEIKARLMATSEPLASLKGKMVAGRLNLLRALDGDFTPPSAPSSLSVEAIGATSLRLSWQESNDARGFEVRFATQPIQNEQDWSEARTVALRVATTNDTGADDSRVFAGRRQIELQGIPVSTNGFLVVRLYDALGNRGVFSENISFQMKPVRALYTNDGNSLTGLEIEGDWGIESVPGVGPVISDSPNGNYGFNRETMLQLPTLKVTEMDMVLSLRMKYDFELGYDFGMIEVSTNDGETWQVVAALTGAQGWVQKDYPLQGFLSRAREVMIRFRTMSDRTTAKDGWHMASIHVLH